MQYKNTVLTEIKNIFTLFNINRDKIALKTLIYYIFELILYYIMKKTLLFLGLLSISVLTSCKKDVTSCIELNKNSVSTGQSIEFTSCSENELSYHWTVTGPETAPENTKAWSDRVITIPLTVSGSYTITLESYSRFSYLGDKATSTATFTVN